MAYISATAGAQVNVHAGQLRLKLADVEYRISSLSRRSLLGSVTGQGHACCVFGNSTASCFRIIAQQAEQI